MSKQTVLISGAGVAGPVLAYWLSRAGIHSTVVERSPSLRTTGQQIDVRGKGLSVVRKMGLEEAVRAKTTKEAGLAFVNKDGKRIAEFPVDKEGGMSFTSDIEILRGDLAKVFYDKSLEGDVEYMFGDYIIGLEEKDNKIHATFKNSEPKAFDLVVAADGQGSKTRDLVFTDKEDSMKWLGMYTSYFTIPYKEEDGDFAQWYNAPGRRSVLFRPDNAGCIRAYLSIMNEAPKEVIGAGVQKQKEMNRTLFADAGWQINRILDGMDKADDFYMQAIVQVKMDSWSKGRVVLLGDAGYCPSPISGMGTTLAIVGAYNLAGCIKQNIDDHQAAFKQYEAAMRPIVNNAQNLPPGAPGIANPATAFGITIFSSILSFVSWTGIARWAEKLSMGKADSIELPDYGF